MEGARRPSGSIERGGRRLAWRSVGGGPPLVLVNGYAATGTDWDPAALRALSRSFEVICPDNRGVGDSQLGDLEAEPLTIDSMATDVEALLDSLGAERAPLAGWSMGGYVAQRLAIRSPRRVERLVLLSTDPGGSAAVPPETWALAQLTNHSGTPREQATRLISLLFPPGAAKQVDERFGELVAAARARLSPNALHAQELAMAAWHAEEQPRPGDDAPPVLVAHGSADLVIPPENAAALAKRWPDCRVERFPGGGHAFMAQEPNRLADLITAFLSE